MAMGKRKRDRQPAMWVTTTNLPTAASHPFYRRLNQLLREHGFDDFAEAQRASFDAETMGRPGLPSGICFRLLLIGHFEGVDSERGIALETHRAVFPWVLQGSKRTRRCATSCDRLTRLDERGHK